MLPDLTRHSVPSCADSGGEARLIARLILFAGFAVLLHAAELAHAQASTADSARLDSARAVLMSVPLGSPIRVLTVGQSMIEGRLTARTDTGIVIRQRRDSSHASIARIAVIYQPAPNYKSGAIIGGITGAVTGGLALGTLAAGFCEARECSGAFGSGAAVGAAIGGALGAVAGLFIGSLTHHWKKVWP